MTIREQLAADLRDGMRAHDETRKSTLRLLLSSIQNAEIPPEAPATDATAGARRQELSDDAILDVIRREVKLRRDSIDAYAKANRNDLVAQQEAEIAILAVYLPTALSHDAIVEAARRIIDQAGAKGPADKGRVMPLIMAELRDKAEGREINAVVTKLLSQSS